MNITGLRVPILNLRDFLLFHFSPAVKKSTTAAYSGFSNLDVFRREIIKLVQIVNYFSF